MLLDALKAHDKKGLFTSDDTFVNYSTGILPLDYANGFWLTRVNQETGEIFNEAIPGILGGKLILIFGATGSGKTTLATQIAYSIIKPFDDGLAMFVDAEQTGLKERIVEITTHDMEDHRIILNVNNTSIEETLEAIDMICKVKEEGGKSLMYEVTNRTYNGESFWAYVPTVIIIDSLRQFNPKNKDIETLGTNMDNAREAQAIARFLDNIINRINKYNITVIYTNHIQPAVNTNQYQQPPRGLMLQPQTESLPRGTRPLFLAHTAIKASSKKSDLYTKEDCGFDGFAVTLQLAKSKTNYIGATITLAFNCATGFDPIYTMFEFAKQCGLIEGRNPHLYLTGMDDMKFSRRNFISKMTTDPEFNRRFMTIMKPYLEDLLGKKESSEDEKLKYGDFATIPVGEIIND